MRRPDEAVRKWYRLAPYGPKDMVKLQARFLPNWFHDQYKMVFGDRYAADVKYRTELGMEQQRLLNKRFGDVGLGSVEPKPELNLGSVYHNLVSLMYGTEIHRTDEDEGWITHRNIGPDEAAALSPPSVEDSPLIQELVRQAKWYVDRYGPALMNPGIDGITNIAFSIAGDEFFTWFVLHPQVVKHMLGIIRQTTVEVHEHFRRLCGQPAPMGLGNCTVCMISPQMYERIVMPYDLIWCRRAQSFGFQFGFHMDGRLDNYAEVIAKFPYLYRVDMGSDTDLRRVRKVLPDKIFRVYLYSHQLVEMTPSQVEGFLGRIVEDGGGAEKIILQLDVCRGMKDETVRAVAGFAQHYHQGLSG